MHFIVYVYILGVLKTWLLRLLYGYCMVTVWLLYGYCMVTVWLLYGYCMVTVWLLYEKCRERKVSRQFVLLCYFRCFKTHIGLNTSLNSIIYHKTMSYIYKQKYNLLSAVRLTNCTTEHPSRTSIYVISHLYTASSSTCNFFISSLDSVSFFL